MKKCENKDCISHRDDFVTGCEVSSKTDPVDGCHIYQRLYKQECPRCGAPQKKVPEKIGDKDLQVMQDGSPIPSSFNMEVFKWKIHEILDYLQEKE